MKKLIVVVLLLVVGLYWYSGRSETQTITEADVREFYRLQYEPANLLDAELACTTMADEYSSVETNHSPGAGPVTMTFDKKKSCDGARESAEMLKKVIAAAGAQPQASYTLRSIEISPDGGTATVKIASKFRIPGKMKVESSGTSSLVKRGDKVLALGGENTNYLARD